MSCLIGVNIVSLNLIDVHLGHVWCSVASSALIRKLNIYQQQVGILTYLTKPNFTRNLMPQLSIFAQFLWFFHKGDLGWSEGCCHTPHAPPETTLQKNRARTLHVFLWPWPFLLETFGFSALRFGWFSTFGFLRTQDLEVNVNTQTYSVQDMGCGGSKSP